MSAFLPDGAVVALATAYGTPKTISALSNANPAVVSAAAHGMADGALFALKSGWQRLNDRIFRADGVQPDSFKIEGSDTSDLTRFPAGTGVGEATPITGFTQVTQILSFDTSGGEQQFANFSFLEEDFERQLPTVTSAQTITIGIADDPSLPGYQALKEAGETRALRALRLTLPNGSIILYNGIVSFNETPTMGKGQVMQVKATFSLQGRPMRYLAN